MGGAGCAAGVILSFSEPDKPTPNFVIGSLNGKLNAGERSIIVKLYHFPVTFFVTSLHPLSEKEWEPILNR